MNQAYRVGVQDARYRLAYRTLAMQLRNLPFSCSLPRRTPCTYSLYVGGRTGGGEIRSISPCTLPCTLSALVTCRPHVHSASCGSNSHVRTRVSRYHHGMAASAWDWLAELRASERRIAQYQRILDRVEAERTYWQGRCGARRHKDGRPCRVKLEPGRKR